MTLKKLALAALYFMGITSVMAAEAPPITLGALTIKDYWVSAPKGPSTAAAYLTVTNSSTPDQLTHAECTEAEKVELHEHVEENGIMSMQSVSGINISDENPLVMKRGGLHIMLMGLKDSFRNKEAVNLTLHFKNAGDITIPFPLREQYQSSRVQ